MNVPRLKNLLSSVGPATNPSVWLCSVPFWASVSLLELTFKELML
jgi:hypothetical protein